jgi:hypothetical protein
MLRSKKALYILVPLVTGIWSLVGYKIYTGIKGDNTPEINVIPLPLINSVEPGIDTFSLFSNYRDPFLVQITAIPHPSSANNPVQSRKNIAVRKNSALPKDEWPTVVYSGIIKNQSNSMALILLSVGGKTYTVKQEEEVEGLKVSSFTNTEVILLKGREKRIIRK